MNELDDFSAPPTTAPAPTRPLDEFSSMLTPSPAAKASVNANASPDDGGKALAIAKQTGIAPSIVQTDLPGYDAHAKTEAAKSAVQNPAIAKYVGDNPMASIVSNDDYATLAKLSPFMASLDPTALDHAASAQLASQVPALAEATSSAPGREQVRGYLERMKSGFIGGFGETSEVARIIREAHEMGLSQNTIDFWEGSGLLPAARATEAAIRLVPGLIGGAVGLGSAIVASLPKTEEGPFFGATGTEAAADRFLREAPAANAALMGTGASALSRAPKFAPVDEFHQFLAEHTADGPRARALSASETPPDELWQAKPIVDQAKAESAGVALDSAVAAAQESKTKERSPELFEEYLAAHGDKGTVHVPAQAILDLYEREGKVPVAGDGLFGWVPGIADKATLAAETGAEVQIPLAKYIANVDPAVHEGLKEQVRVQEKGVTREEAKLAVEEQKAKIEAYHGTPHDFESFDLSKIGTGEGAQVYGHGLYFAENKAVAKSYSEMVPITASGAEALAKQTWLDVGGDYKAAEARLRDYASRNPNPKNEQMQLAAADVLKSGKQFPGSNTYKVQINADPTHFLDWDKPFGKQDPRIQEVVKKLAVEHDLPFHPELNADVVTGEQIYGHLKDVLATREKTVPDKNGFYKIDDGRVAASKALAEAGIPGIKYLDQGSRGAGDGTRNFVVFDDKLVKSTEKNDNPIIQAAVERTLAEKGSLYLQPLFKDAFALNITEPEFKRYSDQIDRAEEKVLERAVKFAKQEASRRLTPEWRANETKMREAVENEVTSSPAYLADRYFNFDKGLLPNGKRILSDAFVPMDLAKADDWAPIFGFESGSEMSAAVLARETARAESGKGPKFQLKQEVDAETARRMEAEHGHLADNIALEASETALADWNVDLLATEWRMLSKLNGREPPLSRSELTSWARDQFDKSTAFDVSYETWRRAAEKGGREAEKALLKGDTAEAFIQKQKQMLNFLLAREAKGFEKEQVQAERLFDKYAGDINLPAVDQAFTDQIHRLLQQYGVDTRRTVENTDHNLQGKPFADFVRDRNANGSMIVAADLPRKPLDQLSVDEYRDFATTIKSLDHNGREAMRIEIAGKKEAFNEVIDKVAKNLDTLEKNDFDPEVRGVVSGLRKLGREVDSRLLKAEKLMDWIDKKDPLSAMNSSVLRGLIEGEQAKGDMITKLAGMAKDLPGDRAWGKALNERTVNRELLDWETGKPMQLTNENKIAIALNYGNESNRRIMLEGYKWKEHEVEAYLARELTPMDKAMVDGIHGLFEPLAPLVEKATSSRAGVAVPLIEPSPALGMKGGYYPLMEDPRSRLLGQQVETDLFQKTKFDPLPTANALKQRTGKVYPVDLSIGQIHARLSQTAHAVFMQDPVINANKVLSSPAVREGVYKAFGPEYVQMLDKWIRDIADNGGSDVGFRDDWAAWLSRNLRQNVTVQLMGWKASTALIHGGSAGASSIYELGKMDMDTTGRAGMSFVTAPARLVKNMVDLNLGQFLPSAARRFFGSQSNIFSTIDFVMDNSGEMRNRQRSLQKDFGFQLNKITNESKLDDLAILRNAHQTYSMAAVAYLDQLTATPVWKAAYDKATVADGMEHADAVFTADKAVREAHGSASLVSRANIGRGEINKWLTIAYNGYWNHNYNKMREAGKEVSGMDDSLSNMQRVAVGAAFATAMIVAPALVHHAVRGDSTGNPGKDIAGALLSQFAGTVPIVNTLTYSLMHNHDPSISPIDEVLKSVVHTGGDIVKGKEQKRDLRTLGYLTGLPPTNQAIDTFTFLNDIMQRRQDPKTPADWARGLMTGKSQPKVH